MPSRYCSASRFHSARSISEGDAPPSGTTVFGPGGWLRLGHRRLRPEPGEGRGIAERVRPEALAGCTSTRPDPLTTDPDKYSLVLENEHVRVLRYHDRPGARTQPHHHRQFVLVTLTPFRRRLVFPDGTVKERDFQAGEAFWMPEQTHTGENVGTTDTNVMLIEVK